MIGRPTGGPGEQDLTCEYFKECQEIAQSRHWILFHCEVCQAEKEKERQSDPLWRATIRDQGSGGGYKGKPGETSGNIETKEEEEKMETARKILETARKIKVCIKCGVEKDLERDFHVDKRSKDGRKSVCKACYRRLYQKAKKDPIEKEQPKPVETEKARVSEYKTLVLDVTAHPEIIEGLEKVAGENFRSIEHQALFFLNEAIH
jgi:hypothetical protein